jgi:hypothetical protein
LGRTSTLVCDAPQAHVAICSIWTIGANRTYESAPGRNKTISHRCPKKTLASLSLLPPSFLRRAAERAKRTSKWRRCWNMWSRAEGCHRQERAWQAEPRRLPELACSGGHARLRRATL